MSESKYTSKTHRFLLIVLTFFVVLGLSIQNGFYGYEQGNSLTKAIVIGCMYFLGDFILVMLAHRYMPKIMTFILGFITMIGLCFLSVFSSSGFLVGQELHATQAFQAQKISDMNHHTDQVIESRRRQIKQLESHIASLPHNWHTNRTNTLNKINIIETEISELTNQRVKPDNQIVAPKNAIYEWTAKAVGSKSETISLFVRLGWSVMFVFASLVMSGILRDTKPLPLPKPEPKIKEPAPDEIITAPDFDDSIAPDNVVSINTAPTAPRNMHLTAPIPAITQDTDRYIELLNCILSGAVKPSTRAVKNYGIGSKQAGEHLKRMLEEGHLIKAGQGYKLHKEAV